VKSSARARVIEEVFTAKLRSDWLWFALSVDFLSLLWRRKSKYTFQLRFASAPVCWSEIYFNNKKLL
jgi:hypothetical protein